MNYKNMFFQVVRVITFPTTFFLSRSSMTGAKPTSKEIIDLTEYFDNFFPLDLKQIKNAEKEVMTFDSDHNAEATQRSRQVDMKRTPASYVSILISVAFIVIICLSALNMLSALYVIISDWVDFSNQCNNHLESLPEDMNEIERRQEIEETYELKEIRKKETLDRLTDQMTKTIPMFIAVLLFPLLTTFLNYLDKKTQRELPPI